MEYNALFLHYLNTFKAKLNSNESSEDFHEDLKPMLSELNNLENIISVHAHKTGIYSIFTPEINDLRLKISSMQRLYPTPKKKMSFFSLQLAKMGATNINKIVSKPLEFEFLKEKTSIIEDCKENEENILNNDLKLGFGVISKKKLKIENLVQDRLNNNNIFSGVKPFLKPEQNNNNNNNNQKLFNNTNFNNPSANTNKNNNSNINFNTNKDNNYNNIYNANNNNLNNNNNNSNNINYNNNSNYTNNSNYNNNNNNNPNKDIYNNNSTNYRKDPPKPNANFNKNPYNNNQFNKDPSPQNNRSKPPFPQISEGFVTAKDQFMKLNPKAPTPNPNPYEEDDKSQAPIINKKFQPPYKAQKPKPQSSLTNSLVSKSKLSDDKLRNIDPKMIEIIESEILDNSPKLSWSDISGLEAPKAKIIEMIVWPFSNPDIFTGIRAPPRGLLLFGPPGTGKTMIGKAVASDTNFTFFSISASSLTSKWVGEGEKMVKTLFMLASAYQPAVVFIDEVDSLLCSRSENENEASRRIKTEFLCQMEGTNTNTSERLLLIGATNRPQELDDAALRRFVKKLYIPLPNKSGRKDFIKSIIRKEMDVGNKYELSEEEIDEIVEKAKGYSGADLRNLCAEAALNPLRGIKDISRLTKESLRATIREDFIEALGQVKPTVSQKDLKNYLDWNRNYGTVQFKEEDLDS